MANPVGSFIWYELMTGDPDGARAFYRAVIGWEISADSGQTSPVTPDYRHILRSDGGSAGGVLGLSAEMLAGGARPGWLPYIHVADVAAAVAAIVAEGGAQIMPPMTIPVGTFALVRDPFGAAFYVMTPQPPPGMDDYTSDVFSPSAVQRTGWNELLSDDLTGAKDFYARHFGFEFNNVMPMGPMGDYCFIDHHGQCLGAMMQRPPEAPAAGWRFYFRVPDIEAARDAVAAQGGTVLNQPHQVAGGDWVVQALDPQGAFVGLVGSKGTQG